MAKYSREQSAAVGLWVLAMLYRDDPEAAIHGATAPPMIVDVVNQLREQHTPRSILLPTHGYNRFLHNRKIGRTNTRIQRQITADLVDQGVIFGCYDP
jgi:hypothetical protein